LGYIREANGYIRLDIQEKYVEKAQKRAITAILFKNVSTGNKAEHLPHPLWLCESISYVVLDEVYCFICRKCFCNLI
jgi:hypothetical protein